MNEENGKIVHEDKYRKFLAGRKLKINTIDSYVSRLHGVSEKMGKPVSPRLFSGDFTPQGLKLAWAGINLDIQQHYTPRALNDCKSNFKRYWEMLVAEGIR